VVVVVLVKSSSSYNSSSSSSSSTTSSNCSSSTGCSYNTMFVRATPSFLPALCQLILDFVTSSETSLLQDVTFSTQLCHETNNLSSSLTLKALN
jgi:hypothetical protein